jgi:hypothetical protein
MPKRIKTFMDKVVGLYERNNKHTRVGLDALRSFVTFSSHSFRVQIPPFIFSPSIMSTAAATVAAVVG